MSDRIEPLVTSPDIVDRLRDPYSAGKHDSDLMVEAADEIERLRKEIDQARAHCTWIECWEATDAE